MVKEILSAATFAGWLREIMERDHIDRRATADRFGMSERTLYAILGGERPTVELGTVERALIADDTTTLRDLYPHLYCEAA